MNVRNAIFFLGIRYMLLTYKRKQQKNSENRHVAYLFKLKSILLNYIKAKKSFKSKIKNVTQYNCRNRQLITLKGIRIETYNG